MPAGCQSCHTVGTLRAAPRAFPGLRGHGGREFLAARRAEPQGGRPRSARGALDIRSPPLGRRAGAEGSPHAHPRGSGKGAAGPVRREGSQVWSWGGARSEREQERGKLSGRATWEPPQPPGLQGGSREDGSADLCPASPPLGPGGRQLRSRFWEGKEVSDCTPPTGVRWAARDGGSEVEVKSPAGLAATPAVFWVGGGGRGGGGVCLFKEE